MVKFSFTNLAFFPDPDLKIVCECNGESGESLYYLQMHGKNVCPISVNSAKSPYTIDFIKPGNATNNNYNYSYLLIGIRIFIR